MYMKNPVNDVNTSYFSEAELRVVKVLASGSSEKEIADRLCISRHTVDNHLRNIRERFGLHKNTEIILLYIAQLNHKPFSLANIKQYGLEVILVLVNICTYTDLKSL
jgi:DNA-binding CsgD family transcriptional regulator